LNLKHDKLLSNLAFKFNLRRYHKDIIQLEEMCRKMPMLKGAKELEYGFMVLDKVGRCG